ncbi:ribonuclease H-like domain-containing protein [Halobaculum lipolyticum]|uniref:Ribonuclease H-like domain-containing protein n=1 Tax=Halobaculum lipolyticum TaxID=3032001 RepID=A0ABD5WBQ9_9EURY|nr:ribonuclease H-like domain-containing protein [Halobaculum sp. DT31]
MANVQRAAFDIETVSPTVPDDEYPDFTDSRDFELSGAAIAYEYTDGSREEMVEWREGWGPKREVELIETLLDRLEPAETVVTYNGERFDFTHLEGRARIAGAEVGKRAHEPVQAYLDGIKHIDLKPDAWEAYGDYTSLEDTLTAVGIDPIETVPGEFSHGIPRSEWSKKPTETVESGDLAVLGEIYLDAVEGKRDDISLSALEEMLSHYARADVELLFDLADARPFE